MILLRYTVDGVTSEYTFPDAKLDELLARADAKFLRPLTAEDERRFRAIRERMLQRMRGKR